MPKFNVGDKVIGNEKANDYSITKEGWIGTVITVDDDGTVEVKNMPGQTAYEGWVSESSFDLYIEPAPGEVRFEVGDIIRPNDHADGEYSVTVGSWRGRVVKVCPTRRKDIDVQGIGEFDDGRTYDVESFRFDIIKKHDGTVPAGAVPTSVPIKGPEALNESMTNKEVFELVFGFTPRKMDCPTASCKDCPFSTDNGGSCSSGDHWSNRPYQGRFVPSHPMALLHRVKTGERMRSVSEGHLKTVCDKFNDGSDSAALNYLKEHELWATEKQYQDLNTLLLMHELIYVHNSETVSETAYNVLLLGYFASIGIGIDKDGTAFVRKDMKK